MEHACATGRIVGTPFVGIAAWRSWSAAAGVGSLGVRQPGDTFRACDIGIGEDWWRVLGTGPGTKTPPQSSFSPLVETSGSTLWMPGRWWR